MSTHPWITEVGSTSPFNQTYEPKDVAFYDTTLRDGEQQSGITFSVEDKLQIFRLLEGAGVPLVETGMIAVTSDEVDVVKRLVAEGHDAAIYVLSRAMASDVNLAADAGVDGITMEICANPVLAEAIFGWDQSQILERSRKGARQARERGLKVNYFLIDASRTDLDWTRELVGTLHEEGLIDEVTLADTFGVCDPSGIHAMVTGVGAGSQLPLQIHAHNDYGLGVVNSLAAVDAGARVVQGTLVGLGERAGNADIPMIAAAMKLMRGWSIGLDLPKLRAASQEVAGLAGVTPPTNYPVVGQTLFDIEAGIAAAFYDGARKTDLRYFYPYLPHHVGGEPLVTLGKGAGLANIKLVAERLQLDPVSDDVARAALEQVKTKGSSTKGLLSDADFVEVLNASKAALAGGEDGGRA